MSGASNNPSRINKADVREFTLTRQNVMGTESGYNKWHYAKMLEEKEQARALYPWHQTVLRIIPDLSDKSVLEVGCGRGDFACQLSERYPSSRIIATDFSGAAIEIVRSKVTDKKNLTFRVADAESLPFEDDMFDYIISCECLEHVESPADMMTEVSRCMKPGAGFVITTENYFNGMILAWIKAWLTGKRFNSGSGIQPRENFFMFWKVKRMIEAAGLKVAHMESNHFVWLLLPCVSPDTFFTEDFANPIWKRAARPFGRHFAYQGIKPAAPNTA